MAEENERLIFNLLSELKNLYVRNLIKDDTYIKYGNFLKKIKNRMRINNAIIINGRVYELIDDSEENECDRCALVVDCNEYREPICVNVFTDSQGKRFKERTDL